MTTATDRETNTDQGPGTRRRLLDAAAELFAARGYRGVAVRDICDQACTNIAGVNYHFGGKDKLYAEAIEHARKCAVQAPGADASKPAPPTPAGPTPPVVKLRKHLRCTLGRAFDAGPAAWYVRMVLRELTEPTGALRQTIDEHIAPSQRKLEGIVAQVIGEDADSERAKDIASALLATTIYYHNCKPAIEHLRAGVSFGQGHAEHLTDTLCAMVVGAAG